MDYTFLPYYEEKLLRREYRRRVIIILLFFVSLAFLVGVGSLFPAYIYSLAGEKAGLLNVAALHKTTDAQSLAAIQKDFSASAAQVAILTGSLKPEPFTSTIEQLAIMRGPIRISTIALEQPSPTSLLIDIGGFAPTRDALVAFKNRLATLSPGTVVTLPISELAKDSNISFSIQVSETLQ